MRRAPPAPSRRRCRPSGHGPLGSTADPSRDRRPPPGRPRRAGCPARGHRPGGRGRPARPAAVGPPPPRRCGARAVVEPSAVRARGAGPSPRPGRSPAPDMPGSVGREPHHLPSRAGIRSLPARRDAGCRGHPSGAACARRRPMPLRRGRWSGPARWCSCRPRNRSTCSCGLGDAHGPQRVVLRRIVHQGLRCCHDHASPLGCDDGELAGVPRAIMRAVDRPAG